MPCETDRNTVGNEVGRHVDEGPSSRQVLLPQQLPPHDSPFESIRPIRRHVVWRNAAEGVRGMVRIHEVDTCVRTYACDTGTIVSPTPEMCRATKENWNDGIAKMARRCRMRCSPWRHSPWRRSRWRRRRVLECTCSSSMTADSLTKQSWGTSQ